MLSAIGLDIIIDVSCFDTIHFSWDSWVRSGAALVSLRPHSSLTNGFLDDATASLCLGNVPPFTESICKFMKAVSKNEKKATDSTHYDPFTPAGTPKLYFSHLRNTGTLWLRSYCVLPAWISQKLPSLLTIHG
jgi:hypothetical protein